MFALRSNTKTNTNISGSHCTDQVLHYLSRELNDEASKRLLKNLGIEDDPELTLTEKLEDVAWVQLRRELEMLEGGEDLVECIQRNTLITKGKALFFSNSKRNRILEIKVYSDIIGSGNKNVCNF